MPFYLDEKRLSLAVFSQVRRVFACSDPHLWTVSVVDPGSSCLRGICIWTKRSRAYRLTRSRCSCPPDRPHPVSAPEPFPVTGADRIVCTLPLWSTCATLVAGLHPVSATRAKARWRTRPTSTLVTGSSYPRHRRTTAGTCSY